MALKRPAGPPPHITASVVTASFGTTCSVTSTVSIGAERRITAVGFVGGTCSDRKFVPIEKPIASLVKSTSANQTATGIMVRRLQLTVVIVVWLQALFSCHGVGRKEDRAARAHQEHFNLAIFHACTSARTPVVPAIEQQKHEASSRVSSLSRPLFYP